MNARLFIKRNSATILSFVAVAGVVATAITSANATPKAVRAGETPKAMVRNSIRQLERAGCPVVGIALSRAKGAANGYYHKYGNYYGKSYYGKGYGYYGKHGYYGYGTEQK